MGTEGEAGGASAEDAGELAVTTLNGTSVRLQHHAEVDWLERK